MNRQSWWKSGYRGLRYCWSHGIGVNGPHTPVLSG
ncbi:Uncharacterised protein [Mycobacteroides abscessus subsp. abscessus]|nr:Uncharacterised protein [Mycobacteroides abscessus subsp. abscessus]